MSEVERTRVLYVRTTGRGDISDVQPGEDAGMWIEVTEVSEAAKRRTSIREVVAARLLVRGRRPVLRGFA